MLDKSFQEVTNDIKNEITKTQLEIMIDANAKLVKLYYNIGKNIFNNYNLLGTGGLYPLALAT